MIESIAEKIIAKYLRKGNLTRCMRDILPRMGLSPEDRGKVSEITHNIVRWRKLYEFILEKQKKEKSPANLVQLAVEKAHEKPPAKGSFETEHSLSRYLAGVIQNLNPSWASYLNQEPPTTLCVNLNKTTVDELIQILKKAKISAEKSIVPTAINASQEARHSPIIKDCLAHIQDESSQLVSAITAELGDRILDYCAGNGGKSLAIASLTKNSKQIFAHDADEKRIRILGERCAAYGAKVNASAKMTVGDKFDVVLVDAPCSGIGAARRNPEAKYLENAGEYPQLQLKVLRTAKECVKKGGFLVYCVCSFTPEETGKVIERFANESGAKIMDFVEIPLSDYLSKTGEGAFTGIKGGDILYVSVLKFA